MVPSPSITQLDLYTNYPVEGRQKSPPQIPDVWLNIVPFLPISDVARCASISRFHRETIDSNYWKELALSITRYPLVFDMGQLVDIKEYTWKDVYHYRNLSSLITTILSREGGWVFMEEQSRLIRRENPDPNYNPFLIRRGFQRYKNYTFVISDYYNVKIKQDGVEEPLILIGNKEPNTYLTHIYVEGDHLFCLRGNGTILQYDYKSKKTVQIIETEYAKMLLDQTEERPPFLFLFYVQDGLIILMERERGRSFIEIISYSTLENKLIIEDEFIYKLLLKDEKLYTITKKNEIVIWDISKPEKIKTIPFNLSEDSIIIEMTINKNLLCFSSALIQQQKLHLIDINTGEQLRNYEVDHRIWRLGKMEIIENFLVASSMKERKKHEVYDAVALFDLNTGKLVYDTEVNYLSSNNLNSPLPILERAKELKIREIGLLIKVIKAYHRNLDIAPAKKTEAARKPSSRPCIIS